VSKRSPLPSIPRSHPGGLIEKLERTEHALTAREVAEIFRVTRGTIYRLSRKHAIPSFFLGGSVLYDPGSLARWIRTTGGVA
jgi:excisionase family DNA binding protein